MKRTNYLILGVLMLAVLLLPACAPASGGTGKVNPVSIKKVDGSEFSQVVLTKRAAERIGIRTEPVQIALVKHTQTVPGEVVDQQAMAVKVSLDPGKVLVRGFINSTDLQALDRNQPALIQPLDDQDAPGIPGETVDDLFDKTEVGEILYFVVGNEKNSLEQGQRVFVELALQGNGSQQKVVPYTSVIYGMKGETWVYVNPEPLVFVRQPVVVDFIDEEMAVLKDGKGPAAGTPVVTVGVDELYGAETGVSK